MSTKKLKFFLNFFFAGKKEKSRDKNLDPQNFFPFIANELNKLT
jgi:hypothetical protein